MKTAFIQNVSHEVRTPLNIISGYAQVIADPDYDITPYERKRMANTMMDNTYVITTMIDEVLEISLSESAGLEHDLTSYPCNDLLRRLLEEFKKMVGDSPITIQYESALDDQFTISTNEGIMRRIIHPLLDNAVKNTTAGQVTLRCSSTPDNLVIQVEDTGRGIPANQAEHIFERFVKLDSFKEGMGLGLTFSRAMTTRLGGNVRLDTSYAGPGARFEVTIPLVHQQ
jgi:signal transduction histidine kinase